MPTFLDEHLAWPLIRHVARLDWNALAEARAESPAGVALHVRRGGDWHCSGEVTPQARALLDGYLPLACVAGRFAIAQLGQSVDGRIATACGHSRYVTGAESLVHLHRLRALVDAVIVGADTASADDPQLTVRHVEGDNPVRVILDPRGRVEASRRVFCEPAAKTLHLVAPSTPAVARAGHVTALSVAGDASGFAPRTILDVLARRGLRRVLVEGGGLTVSRFLQAGCLQRLQVTVAPLLIGSGRAALTLPEIDTLDDALRPSCRLLTLGTDVLFDFDLVPHRGRPEAAAGAA